MKIIKQNNLSLVIIGKEAGVLRKMSRDDTEYEGRLWKK